MIDAVIVDVNAPTLRARVEPFAIHRLPRILQAIVRTRLAKVDFMELGIVRKLKAEGHFSVFDLVGHVYVLLANAHMQAGVVKRRRTPLSVIGDSALAVECCRRYFLMGNEGVPLA